jgi:hypothetical protein
MEKEEKKKRGRGGKEAYAFADGRTDGSRRYPIRTGRKRERESGLIANKTCSVSATLSSAFFYYGFFFCIVWADFGEIVGSSAWLR